MNKVLIEALGLFRVFRAVTLPSSCRFAPSCSVFAAEALEKRGLWDGIRLTVGRLLRCHPLNPGGFDPVPSP